MADGAQMPGGFVKMYWKTGYELEDLSTIEGFEQFLKKQELTDANGNPYCLWGL